MSGRVQWEYLILHQDRNSNWSRIRDMPSANRLKTTVTIVWTITQAGEKPLVIEDRKYSEILEQLGNDGWELVSERTIGTTIFQDINGNGQGSSPVRSVMTFKRPK